MNPATIDATDIMTSAEITAMRSQVARLKREFVSVQNQLPRHAGKSGELSFAREGNLGHMPMATLQLLMNDEQLQAARTGFCDEAARNYKKVQSELTKELKLRCQELALHEHAAQLMDGYDLTLDINIFREDHPPLDAKAFRLSRTYESNTFIQVLRSETEAAWAGLQGADDEPTWLALAAGDELAPDAPALLTELLAGATTQRQRLSRVRKHFQQSSASQNTSQLRAALHALNAEQRHRLTAEIERYESQKDRFLYGSYLHMDHDLHRLLGKKLRPPLKKHLAMQSAAIVADKDVMRQLKQLFRKQRDLYTRATALHKQRWNDHIIAFEVPVDPLTGHSLDDAARATTINLAHVRTAEQVAAAQLAIESLDASRIYIGYEGKRLIARLAELGVQITPGPLSTSFTDKSVALQKALRDPLVKRSEVALQLDELSKLPKQLSDFNLQRYYRPV